MSYSIRRFSSEDDNNKEKSSMLGTAGKVGLYGGGAAAIGGYGTQLGMKVAANRHAANVANNMIANKGLDSASNAAQELLNKKIAQSNMALSRSNTYKIASKAGKYGAIAAGVGAALYGANKLMGGSSNNNSNPS